jgi:hypothetical protein
VWLGTSNGYIDLIDAATGETLSSTRHRSAAVHTLVEAGGFVWATSTDGQVAVFNAKTGKIVCTLDAHRGKVAAVISLLPDKPMVWSIGADMVIRVWNTTQPFACEKELSAQSYMISMCYHLGVVWIGTESAILRYNIQSYRKMDMLTRGGASIPCVNCLVSMGEYVWSLAGDNIIDIWAPTGERIKRIEHTQRMLSIAAVGPDQIWVCSSSSIRAMTADAEVIHTIKKPHYDATKAVAYVVVGAGEEGEGEGGAGAEGGEGEGGADGGAAAAGTGADGAVVGKEFCLVWLVRPHHVHVDVAPVRSEPGWLSWSNPDGPSGPGGRGRAEHCRAERSWHRRSQPPRRSLIHRPVQDVVETPSPQGLEAPAGSPCPAVESDVVAPECRSHPDCRRGH